MSEEHVFHAAFQIFVCPLQEAVKLIDMLQQDVCYIRDRLFQMLMQQMDAEDDLRDGLRQGMKFAFRVVSPMTVVCKVP